MTDTETREITNSEDVIDVRDITERVEYLETLLPRDEETEEEDEYEIDREELQQLTGLLDDLRGNGGDHDWRGSWYPVTLIRDGYFETYAQELADDIGAINKDAGWPTAHIDWEAAADALKIDYSTVEFGDVTYWYR